MQILLFLLTLNFKWINIYLFFGNNRGKVFRFLFDFILKLYDGTESMIFMVTEDSTVCAYSHFVSSTDYIIRFVVNLAFIF